MLCNTLPVLSHAQARLRVIEADDLPYWAAYLQDPVVFQHTSWNLASAQELAHYVTQEHKPDSLFRVAIADKHSNQLIGTIGFHTVSSLNQSAEIAYDLAASHWGRGIASAAVGALTQWAHQQAGVLRVQATVLESNLASRRVLEKNGFVYEGLLRSYRQVRGKAGNFWIFSHLAD